MKICKQWIRSVVRWGPAFSLMALIYLASGTPSDRIPTLVRGDDLVKKGGHALGYGLLALAYVRGFDGRVNRVRVLAFTMAGLFAFSDEYHQKSTPGRTPSLRDVGFDLAGAALGLFLHARCPAVRRLIRIFLDQRV
jgi:VanZ family protein